MGKRMLYPVFRGGRLPAKLAAWLDAKALREETTTSALIRQWVADQSKRDLVSTREGPDDDAA
jgi:hypothetical protein